LGDQRRHSKSGSERQSGLAVLNKANDASHPPADYNVYYSTNPLAFDGTETKWAAVCFHVSNDTIMIG
jgi:hypothetical protein